MTAGSWLGKIAERSRTHRLSRPEALVVGLTLALVLGQAIAERSDTRIGEVGLLALLIVGWVPLLALPRWPIPSACAITVTQMAHMMVVPVIVAPQISAIPWPAVAATWLLALRLEWRSAWLGGITISVILVLTALLTRQANIAGLNFIGLDLVIAGTGFGVLMRSQAERLGAVERRAEEAERTRDIEARRRVHAERLKIAREIHDVVAHNLTLVNAQSSVAEFLLASNPQAAAEALRDISEHSREALHELRATVGLLRSPDEDDRAPDDELPVSSMHDGGAALSWSQHPLRPVPGLSDLDDLVAAHAAAGGRVEVLHDGRAMPLPPIGDASAYRIIQEALTNARKHAPTSTVTLSLKWTSRRLLISISNRVSTVTHRTSQRIAGIDAEPAGAWQATAQCKESTASPVYVGDSTGYGIIGMKERAEVAGARLSVGPREAGSIFVVEAEIPVSAQDHAATAATATPTPATAIETAESDQSAEDRQLPLTDRHPRCRPRPAENDEEAR